MTYIYRSKLEFLEILLNKKYYFNITTVSTYSDKDLFNKIHSNFTIDIYDKIKEDYDKSIIDIIQSDGSILKDDYYKYMKYKIKYLKLKNKNN